MNIDNCLFCEKSDGKEKLRNFSTLEAGENVHNMVCDLQDTELMVKTTGADLVALEAKYHLKCLVNLQHRHRSFLRAKIAENQSEERLNEARAMVELHGHIQETIEEGEHIFKLSDLHSLYTKRLSFYGIDSTKNKTKLKESLLQNIQKQRNNLMESIHTSSFQRVCVKCCMRLCNKKVSWEANTLAKAAKIIRDNFFQEKRSSFNGSFEKNCHETYVPHRLKVLVSMILFGANISDHDLLGNSPEILTISQILLFNMKKKFIKDSAKSYHRANQEPPWCTMIGLYLHKELRHKSVIQRFNHYGICPSYDQIIKIEDELTSAVCEQYEPEGVVIPCQLQKGRFTVAAVDNIDYNLMKRQIPGC